MNDTVVRHYVGLQDLDFVDQHASFCLADLELCSLKRLQLPLLNEPNPEQAVKFLEYLTTPEAQKYFAEGNNEYPVVEGVEPDPVLAKWGHFKTDAIDAASYGENNAEAVKIMDRAGWK